MTTIFDISLAAAFYIFPVIGIILLFSVLLRGVRHVGPPFLWRQWRSYVQLFGWMLDATKITDSYLIAHSGLDSVVYLRLYLIGLKIFSPIAIVAGFTLIPVNSGNSMETDFLHINVDRFMMTNIPDGSNKLWVHFMMAYVFSAWTCYVLHREYKYVLSLRKGFYASGKFHPELFTVLVQNIPHDPQKSTSEVVNHFFIANHGEQYLGHKIVYKTSKLAKMIAKKKIMENRLRCYSSTCRRNPSKKPSCWIGLLRLFGCTPDAIKSYNSEIDNISSEIKEEHQRLKFDTTCMMQTALVSFRTQWGAAVCAKTLQHDNPFIWLTKQAPEPKDIYWENLGVNSISTATRELGGIVAFLFILIGSTIPLSVISLQIMKLYGNFPLYLEPISFRHALEVVMQGFIPGIFLDVLVSRLCHIFRYMVKFEGCTSRSSIERRSAIRFYIFLVVDGCFGCLLYGAANKQLKILYKMPLYETLRKIALVVPNQFIFFVTLVMFEGWVARAWELLEFEPLSRLIKFVCSFYYNTEREGTDARGIRLGSSEPRVQMHILLGLVYFIIAPLFLPFLVIDFMFGYIFLRHQVHISYKQQYESGGAFWPDVNDRILTGLIISQLVVFGLLSIKHGDDASIFLLPLVGITILFQIYCKRKYKSLFFYLLICRNEGVDEDKDIEECLKNALHSASS